MQIIWSKEANESYVELLDFLYKKYSVDTVIALDEKVLNLLDKLKTNQYLCPPSKAFIGYRKCVLSKQTSLIYRTDGTIVEIMLFVDNRSEHGF